MDLLILTFKYILKIPFDGPFFNLPNFLKSISTFDMQILKQFAQQHIKEQLSKKVEWKNSPSLQYSFINFLYTTFFFPKLKIPGLLSVPPHIQLTPILQTFF